MKCEDVWREVSNYLDRTLEAPVRQQVDAHLENCAPCKSVVDGIRNTIALTGEKSAFQLPKEVSRRLYAKLDQHLQAQADKPIVRQIPVGITDDNVALGSHLIYFWESDADFERGVRFLSPGFGKNEHCIAFGHIEALEKVQASLRAQGFDPDELVRSRKLTILRRQSAAHATLSDISDIVQAALAAGATAIRFLGNLGMGRDPLPAGEDDVLELESKVDTLISGLPCVIVCMYDVRTLSGRLVTKGGLQAHHLAVCSHSVRENPYYAPESDSVNDIHTVH